MSWIRTAATDEIRVYEAGNYRIIGALHAGHPLDYTLSYHATGLGSFPTLIAAKARAREHTAEREQAVVLMRAHGRLN